MRDFTPEQNAEREQALHNAFLDIREAEAEDALDLVVAFKAIRAAYMHGYVAALRVRADEP